MAALPALACVIFLQPLFVGSLAFVRSHTDLEPIRQNIAAAFEQGVLSVDEVPRLLIHRYGHQFTECVALQLSLDDEKNVPKAVLEPQLHSRYVGPCGELHDVVAGKTTSDRTDYSRYWHGYRLYEWLMLEHVSLQNMRFINAFVLVAILAFFFRSLRAAIGPTPATILFLVLMSLTDIWRIWRITPHFLSMVVILAGTGLFAKMYVRHRDATLAVVLAAALGAVFNFIDFLINPPMLPLFLSFIVLAVEATRNPHPTRQQTVDTLWLAGLTTLSWFGGYALTWGTKWFLAVWLSDHAGQTMSEIFAQIALRLYGQEADGPVPIIPLLPTIKMIGQSFISVGSVWVAILAAAIFLHLRRTWNSFDRQRFFILMSPTIIPVVWFELLSNHTQTHLHFTYRSEAASIAIFFAAIVMAMPAQPSLKSLLGNLQDALRRHRLAVAGQIAAFVGKRPVFEKIAAGEQLPLAFDIPAFLAPRAEPARNLEPIDGLGADAEMLPAPSGQQYSLQL